MEKTVIGAGFRGAMKFVAGIVIGGAIASTTVAVFAISMMRIERYESPLIIEGSTSILSPSVGDVVGWNIPVQVSTRGVRSVAKVEVYQLRSIDSVLLGTTSGNGASEYTIPVSTSSMMDHSFVTLYAKIYSPDSSPVTTDTVHVQIDRCLSEGSCIKTIDTTQVPLNGLIPTNQYTVSWYIKTAYEGPITSQVIDTASGTILTDCSTTIFAKEWTPSDYCSFVATSSDALLSFHLSETDPENIFFYLDNVVLSGGGEKATSQTIAPTSWSGSGTSIVSHTPVTNRKPFAPTAIYSVDSTFPISDSNNLGVWFFKGWPRAHYSWWTRLGRYERPSLNYDLSGEYSFTKEATDRNAWYSPLMLWFTRETTDPSSFSYQNQKLTVTTDIGTLDICLPDIDWDSSLINGFLKTRLEVDEYGNTYYANKYNDPDLLTYDNVAKLCTCTDGTAIGQCTRDGMQYCNEDGHLEASDCRTCGCSASRQTCEEQPDGSYSCELPLNDIEKVPL